MTYHNTNKESGSELKSSVAKTRHQEDLILEYFKLHADSEFTPFEIQSALGLMATPITSIRRAITNLTTDNKLVKTDNQKEGQYGKKNFCWKFNDAYSGVIEPATPVVADMYKILEEEKKFQVSELGAPSVESEGKSKADKQQKLFS